MLTVGELTTILEDYPSDSPVYCFNESDNNLQIAEGTEPVCLKANDFGVIILTKDFEL